MDATFYFFVLIAGMVIGVLFTALYFLLSPTPIPEQPSVDEHEKHPGMAELMREVERSQKALSEADGLTYVQRQAY